MTKLWEQAAQRINDLLVNDDVIQTLQRQYVEAELRNYGLTIESALAYGEDTIQYDMYYELCGKFQARVLGLATTAA
jgi:hypothetical protein